MPNPLTISLFGPLQIRTHQTLITTFASRKAEALFVYLLLNPTTHSRETLADLLWDDRPQKQALGNLRVLLSNLRKLFPDHLEVNRQTVKLIPTSADQVDAFDLETALAPLRPTTLPTPDEVARLKAVLSQVHASFLDGFFIRDATRYEEWLLLEREKRQQQLRHGLGQLARAQLAYGAYDSAKHTARQLLQLDPFHEEAARLSMRVLSREGQSTQALQLYQRFKQDLAEELDLLPAPETERMAHRIRQIKRSPPPAFPQNSTPTIGREREIATIAQRFNREMPHPAVLITLQGIGGMGKTHLARAIGYQLQQDYLNGVVFVPLASTSTHDDIVSQVSQSLDIEQSAKADPAEQIAQFLAEREMLIILDNAEQAIEPLVDWLRPLLSRTPDVQWLITSRERLQLREEWVFPIDGLTRSDTEDPAVSLFHDRLKQFSTDLDPAEFEETILEICELVGRVPLAIELAAATCAYHHPPTVAQEIRRNLDFLMTHFRDIPARHRSMRAVFDHSWALLEPSEQMVYAQLSLFDAGFTMSAAETITGANRLILESLLNKSLVTRAPHGRYAIHELLRHYAGQRIEDLTDGAATISKFQAYFSRYLQDHLPNLESATPENLKAIQSEIDNIRKAWRYAIGTERTDQAFSMLSGLTAYVYVRGQFKLGLDFLSTIRTRFEQYSAEQQADIMARQALFWLETGEYTRAIAQAEEVLTPPWIDNRVAQALANFCIGYAHWSQSRFDEAEHILKTALRQSQAIELRWIEAQCLSTLGIVILDQGDPTASTVYLRAALEIASQLNQPRPRAGALINLGNSHWHMGQYPEAKAYFKQALKISQAHSLKQIESLASLNAGLVSSEEGAFDESIEAIQYALDLSREVGDRRGEGNALLNLLVVYMEAGRIGPVIELIPVATSICQEVGDQQGEAILLDLQGNVYLKLGDLDQAERAIQETRVLCESIADTWGLMEIEISQAALCLNQARYEEGIQHALIGIENAQQLESQPSIARLHLILGQLYFDLGRYDESLAAFVAAEEGFGELDQAHYQMEVAIHRLRLSFAQSKTVDDESLDRVLVHLKEKPLVGIMEPAKLYSDLYRLLIDIGDERAKEILIAGRESLRQTAEQIQSPKLKETYLTKRSVVHLGQIHGNRL